VQVVGPIFRPQKYGIAIAEGSALRKPTNEALLELYDDGTYEKIYARWFSPGNSSIVSKDRILSVGAKRFSPRRAKPALSARLEASKRAIPQRSRRRLAQDARRS
jgi:hypothetical protein